MLAFTFGREVNWQQEVDVTKALVEKAVEVGLLFTLGVVLLVLIFVLALAQIGVDAYRALTCRKP